MRPCVERVVGLCLFHLMRVSLCARVCVCVRWSVQIFGRCIGDARRQPQLGRSANRVELTKLSIIFVRINNTHTRVNGATRENAAEVSVHSCWTVDWLITHAYVCVCVCVSCMWVCKHTRGIAQMKYIVLGAVKILYHKIPCTQKSWCAFPHMRTPFRICH